MGEEPIRPPRPDGRIYPFDKRSIHRIRPGREHAEEWENPVLALYQPDKFRQTRLFEPDRFIDSTLPKMRDGYRKWRAQKTKR